MKSIYAYISAIFTLLFAGCKQPYEPPAIKGDNRYLVVEGVINTASNSRTTIVLSRTRNLVDTFLTSLEKGAVIRIESSRGAFYSLADQGSGAYTSALLNLDTNDNYRLRIFTSNGQEYISDLVQAQPTPPIDSITWKKENEVTIYASTHNPQNNTKYYRWDFTETWQYRPVNETDMGVNVGMIFYRDSTNQIYNCWREQNGTDIVLASTVKLSQDVIDHIPLTVIAENSERLGVRYSIIVRQYGLTENGYQYWETLQKNTQKLGSLFDAQPSQLKSNIRNVNRPAEPVIGYLSACNIEVQRIFIRNSEVAPWVGMASSPSCGNTVMLPVNSTNYLIYNYSDTTYAPYYFCCSGGALVVAKKDCLDCTRRGGTNQKPSFW